MECAICYENVNLGKYQTQPCCKHVFHWNCLVEWYNTLYNINKELNNSKKKCNFQCPMCRTNNNLVKCIKMEEFIHDSKELGENKNKKQITTYISKRLDINHLIKIEEQVLNIDMIYQSLNNYFDYFKDNNNFMNVALSRFEYLYRQLTEYKNESNSSELLKENSTNTINTLVDFKKKVDFKKIINDPNMDLDTYIKKFTF